MRSVVRLFVVLIGLISFAYASYVPIVGVKEAKQLIDKNKAVVIDVREEAELTSGVVKGALVLPMSKMNDNRASFDRDVALIPKDKTLIVYCASGRRAGIVGAELEKMGFKVLNMGKFNSWKEAGFPVETKE